MSPMRRFVARLPLICAWPASWPMNAVRALQDGEDGSESEYPPRSADECHAGDDGGQAERVGHYGACVPAGAPFEQLLSLDSAQQGVNSLPGSGGD